MGAIYRRLFLRLLAKAFRFQLANLCLGLVELGLQLCIALCRSGMHAFSVTDIATQFTDLLT